MRIYSLKYSTEEDNITYGIFSTKEKAEIAKQKLVSEVDEDMRSYWERELYISEKEINVLFNRINH